MHLTKLSIVFFFRDCIIVHKMCKKQLHHKKITSKIKHFNLIQNLICCKYNLRQVKPNQSVVYNPSLLYTRTPQTLGNQNINFFSFFKFCFTYLVFVHAGDEFVQRTELLKHIWCVFILYKLCFYGDHEYVYMHTHTYICARARTHAVSAQFKYCLLYTSRCV